MKTEQLTNKQCQSSSRLSSSWASSLRGLWCLLSHHASKASAPVFRALAAILAADSNRRTYTAFVLIALGPLVEASYLMFNERAGDPSAYWNTYYYLYVIGPDVAMLMYATGFYLLLPELSRVKLFALVPATYKLARIIYMAFVGSNAEYHRFIPIAFLLVGLAASLSWFLVFEYLMNLHFHKRSGHIARAEGILSAPDIDSEKQVTIALQELRALKNLN